MRQLNWNLHHTLALILAGLLAAVPAFAEKPSWNHRDKSEKHQRHEKKQHDRDYDDRHFDRTDRHDYHEHSYFDDRHRTIIHDYYAQQFNSGHCPPGLAKKRNGCMPPGQAKKWRIGRPLPRDVIYYDLPREILMQMGPPMPGYRYARVGTDILLMAIGTGMIVDAIMDLSGN